MKVIKNVKDSGEKAKVNYPTKWGREVIGLDSNIEYYEIKELEKPDFNPNQFRLVEKIKLTTKKGEFLNIAEIEFIKQEKSEQEIISNLDAEIGTYLDSEYPFDRRIKYDTEGTTLAIRKELGQELTESELARLLYLESLRNWVAECRQQRKDAIKEYKKTGVLPTITWTEKPIKI